MIQSILNQLKGRAAEIDRMKTRAALRRLRTEPAPAMAADYVIRIPRGVRLHQVADFAAGINHKLELAGDGRELRLVPREAEEAVR